VKFVKEGGKLQEVPVIHRRDEVSFWATSKFKVSGDADLMKTWSLEVLPFIPPDVLFYNYLLNGIPWANKADEEAKKRPQPVYFFSLSYFLMHYNNMLILFRILLITLQRYRRKPNVMHELRECGICFILTTQ